MLPHIMSTTLKRDVTILLAATLALSAVSMNLHADLPLVAAPPDPADASCGADELVPEQLPRITVAELRKQLGTAQLSLIDARSRAEFDAGHVPGAYNLPAHEAAGILEVQSIPVDINELVVTYCDGGEACYLSEYLGLLLRDEVQCKTVRVLEGGWTAWLAAHGPVEGEGMTYVP